MKSKAWMTDDPDFLSSEPRSPGLLGRPTKCFIAVAVIVYVALSQLLTRWTPAIAAPPSPKYILVPSPSAVAQLAQARNPDRFVKAAPRDLDERAVVTARPTIDTRIILDPYPNTELRTAAIFQVPRAGTPPSGRIVIPRLAPVPKLHRATPIRPRPR